MRQRTRIGFSLLWGIGLGCATSPGGDGVSVSVSTNPEDYRALARRLPEAPMHFRPLEIATRPDWRRMEGWAIDGLEISRFDRLSNVFGALVQRDPADTFDREPQLTWGHLIDHRDGAELTVACHQQIYGIQEETRPRCRRDGSLPSNRPGSDDSVRS